MQHIKIKKGLDLQLAGSPEQKIFETIETDTVAITSHDFPALQPEFSVQTGDTVKQGQTLFVDRHNPELRFVSPIKGTIEAIETGRRRTLDTVSIRRHSSQDNLQVAAFAPASDRESVQTLLLKSGLWTAFRTRPFNRVPVPRTVPADIFVTAMDSNPLAADPRAVLIEEMPAFKAGLAALPMLTEGNVYVCQRPGSPLAQMQESGIIDVSFSGPHPAGLAGTHIHFLAPVSRERMVWYVDYQDIIALGHLVTRGIVQSTRVVALSGSGVNRPRLVRATLGSNLQELLANNLLPEPAVVYSGSVLAGRRSQWLGRYHSLLTVLRAEQPGGNKPPWLQRLQESLVKYTSADQSVVPEHWLEKVSPLRILPVPLLRALALGNLEQAESLGCLELSEEDISLFSWVCPSQSDYATLLNACLARTAEEESQ